MSEKNYKLIYEVREAFQPWETSCLSNLEITAANKARDEAKGVHQRYVDFLTKKLGHDDFEVTNEVCLTDGIIGHVYTPKGGDGPLSCPPRGLGKRKCIFCGCDDFDF